MFATKWLALSKYSTDFLNHLKPQLLEECHNTVEVLCADETSDKSRKKREDNKIKITKDEPMAFLFSFNTHTLYLQKPIVRIIRDREWLYVEQGLPTHWI